MDFVALTEEIIRSIVTEKDFVKVKQFDSNDDNVILIEAFVKEEDMAKVIGKNGKVINAIRTLVQASSYTRENKIIKINIESI